MLLAVLIGVGLFLIALPLVSLFHLISTEEPVPFIICTLCTIIYWIITGVVGEFIYGVKWG